MAVEIVKTKYTDSEVSKTSDFQHTADSSVTRGKRIGVNYIIKT